MNHTTIEWVKNPAGTQGYTWNPITGCLNGCPYCYARRLANGRLKPLYQNNKAIAPLPKGYYTNYGSHILTELDIDDPFYPRFWAERVREEFGADTGGAEPKGIFVCDMSDLFGIGVPEEWTRRILNHIGMSYYKEHRFYLLTKQPQNLIKFSPFSPNCWVGVTATNHTMLIEARHYLARIEATIKFVSLEPLLEWHTHSQLDWLVGVLKSINWLIIGAQTKPYKPPKIEWVEEIVQAADKAGIPVFLKNNLAPALEVRKPFIETTRSYTRYPRQEMPG